MGGSGGGIAFNREEFAEICSRGLDASPTHEVLIEESVLGWKEFEMEVVRDRKDNCIIICSIENIDPMGVHTGDSITVAPAQTLTDKEYQIMRNASFAVLREIGVETGGSNVQFAINPANGQMVVIEMNPRVSRSSALASKATGFPIAKVAAKLAVGYTLDEIGERDHRGRDAGLLRADARLRGDQGAALRFREIPAGGRPAGTQMKSVGEVMAMGRTFQESFQKALRGLETGAMGLDEKFRPGEKVDQAKLVRELSVAGSDRIWFVGDAFRHGMTLEEVHQLTKIDPWFLTQIEDIVREESQLLGRGLEHVTAEQMRHSSARVFPTAASLPC
jgi:carbamoyl-phosphate synthase large subunit